MRSRYAAAATAAAKEHVAPFYPATGGRGTLETRLPSPLPDDDVDATDAVKRRNRRRLRMVFCANRKTASEWVRN